MNHDWQMMDFHDAYFCTKCGDTCYRVTRDNDNQCYPQSATDYNREEPNPEILRQLGHGLR